MADIYKEYRGVDNLVYAKLIQDTEETIEYGEVKPLAAVAEISKTTETSEETHYYDNMAAVVISATGPDEITCSVAAIDLETLADITGQVFDADTGALIEGERKPTYCAIGYRTKKTDGTYVYVWRYKGMCSIPDSTHATEDDGTDANGQEIVFTCIQTTHKFTKTGAGAKGITVDGGLGKADVSTFFDDVTTPDTIKAKA